MFLLFIKYKSKLRLIIKSFYNVIHVYKIYFYLRKLIKI